MPATRSVLIVDRSVENRDVLRTVLQQRGVQTWEAGEGEAGRRLAAEHRPDVIVLDVDSSPPAALAAGEETPLVLLGSIRRQAAGPNCEVLSKPYHYAPLIRRIEALLDAR